MAQVKEKKYRIRITYETFTDGEVDGDTLVNEYSEDLPTHLAKQSAFSAELTSAIDRVAQRMIDLAGNPARG